MTEIDISQPRKKYLSSEVRDLKYCPDCNTKLVNESQTYYMTIRVGKYEDPQIIGNDAGYFCPNCPVVVLDAKKMDKFAEIALGRKPIEYAYRIDGILDLSKIPKEKRSVRIGSVDNPVPLVKFSNQNEMPQLVFNIEAEETEAISEPIIKVKKIGRNDLCSCNSGLKYKKCCGKT